jgi:hypothetical protein
MTLGRDRRSAKTGPSTQFGRGVASPPPEATGCRFVAGFTTQVERLSHFDSNGQFPLTGPPLRHFDAQSRGWPSPRSIISVRKMSVPQREIHRLIERAQPGPATSMKNGRYLSKTRIFPLATTVTEASRTRRLGPRQPRRLPLARSPTTSAPLWPHRHPTIRPDVTSF